MQSSAAVDTGGIEVHVLADVAIGEVAQFLDVFSTDGLAKRKEHGCLGTQVLVPAEEAGRVLVLLEWASRDDFDAFRNDPTAPPIMRKGGAQGPPTFTVLDPSSSSPAEATRHRHSAPVA